MSVTSSNTPFELLLQVVEGLPVHQLEAIRSCIPLMRQSQWESGQVVRNMRQEWNPGALESVVSGVFSRLGFPRQTMPDWILVFFLTNWDQMEPGDLDQALQSVPATKVCTKVDVILLSSPIEGLFRVICAVQSCEHSLTIQMTDSYTSGKGTTLRR